MEVKMSKKDLGVIGIILFMIIAFSAIETCNRNSDNNKNLEREDYQMFKAVKIPEDTVYVDPITVGTTTDPDDTELTHP
jgi:hypothetical protein